MTESVATPHAREDEFKRELDNCFHELRRFALARCNNREDALEIFQRSLEKGWERFEQFKEGSSFKAWMTMIIRNTQINRFRKRTKMYDISNNHSFSLEEYTTSEKREDPERILCIREGFSDEVLEAVQEVPEKYRRVVLLREILDKPYKEIAEEMDLSVGTVMSRLYRGRRMMKKELVIRINPKEYSQDFNEDKFEGEAYQNHD